MKISRKLIDITGLRDIIQRRIPVLTIDSQVSGPVVWLTACLHGDEVGGTVIVHDTFALLKRHGLTNGAVHAFPLVNSMGFENVSRFINTEREDLNRCFPGKLRGTMGQQIARRLYDTIMKTQPMVVIDLHNDWIRSIPHVLVEAEDMFPRPELAQQAEELARATGMVLVLDTDRFAPDGNSLAGAMAAAGVAAFTLEAGGAYSVVETNVRTGVAAVTSVLHQLGMISWAPDESEGFRAESPRLRYTNEPLCRTSGLIRYEVTPGDRIAKGQRLARVFSAFGSIEETLKARAPGILLGLDDHARVIPGCEVVAIGEFEQP